MHRDSRTRQLRPFRIVVPSQRSMSWPAFESMTLQAAEAEQNLSATWLRKLLGVELHADLARALDWQSWCWGRDVADIPGNGLLRMNFERFPPPQGIKSSSCYRQTQRSGDGTVQRIALRGCGLFFGQDAPAGITLSRYRFSPCFHFCEQYPPLNWLIDRSLVVRAPRTDTEQQQMLKLIVGLLNWIAGYERTVHQLFGATHREECRRKWKKLVPLDQADLPASWQEFASTVEQLRDGNTESPSVQTTIVELGGTGPIVAPRPQYGIGIG